MTAVPIVAVDDLRRKVGFADLIEPVSSAFRQSSAGEADNGFILMLPGERPEDGDAFVKTGVLRGHSVFIVKIAPWFAANVQAGQPQGGFVGVFDSLTGHTRAILADEHYLSDIRTAAAGALSARLFAPNQARTAAVLGAGVQAYWQSLALHHERLFERLLVWARDEGRAQALIARLAEALPDVELSIARSPEAAVKDSEIVLTTTLARDPIVKGEWLQPGQHITAVGADDPTKCELDGEALRRARVFVDDRKTAAENGDVNRAIAAGEYRLDELAGEIGEVIAGRVPGRISDEQITVAKLVGLGAQDVAAAEVALEKLNL